MGPLHPDLTCGMVRFRRGPKRGGRSVGRPAHGKALGCGSSISCGEATFQKENKFRAIEKKKAMEGHAVDPGATEVRQAKQIGNKYQKRKWDTGTSNTRVSADRGLGL